MCGYLFMNNIRHTAHIIVSWPNMFQDMTLRNDTKALKIYCSNDVEMCSCDIIFSIQLNLMAVGSTPTNTQYNKRVITTPKRRFHVIITCLLRCVLLG